MFELYLDYIQASYIFLCSVNSIIGSDGKLSSVKSTGSEGSCCPTLVDFKGFKVTWNKEIYHNRETWKAQAAKGKCLHSVPFTLYMARSDR